MILCPFPSEFSCFQFLLFRLIFFFCIFFYFSCFHFLSFRFSFLFTFFFSFFSCFSIIIPCVSWFSLTAIILYFSQSLFFPFFHSLFILYFPYFLSYFCSFPFPTCFLYILICFILFYYYNYSFFAQLFPINSL